MDAVAASLSDRRDVLRWLFAALVLLPFVSKITLGAVGMPEKFSVLWMQGGLHPVINSVLSVALLTAAFLAAARRGVPATVTEKSYLTALVGFGVVLGIQSLLQGAFEDLNVELWMHFSGVVLTAFLLFGYGWLVPRLGSLEFLFRLLTWVTRALLIVSMMILVARPDFAFKGTRFVGVFKHIPYMVTCCQLVLLVEWHNLAASRGFGRWVAGFFLFLGLFSLALTGTRSAALCGLGFMAMAILRWPVRGKTPVWIRRSVIYLGVVFTLTVGPFAAMEVEALLKGESSFLRRPAQNGIASRMEEAERGLATLEESPYLGKGLLHRFGSESIEAAGSYNSFRDPHNILISAGVIGGWPLLVAVGAGLAALGAFLLREIFTRVRDLADYRVTLLNIYLLSHLPILVVYHVHLSLGGLADRIYWLFIGCVFSARGLLATDVRRLR